MDMLSEYIKDIAVFVVFSASVQMLIPNGKFKPYIELVLGIILVFVMLKPIKAVSESIISTVENAPTDLSLENEELSDDSQVLGLIIKSRLENSISDRLSENFEVEKVECEINKEAEEIKVEEIRIYSNADEMEIKQYLLNELQINNDCVKIIKE